MGKGNKQYYEFSNYIEETNNEHDSKNKIKIFKVIILINICEKTRKKGDYIANRYES